MASENSRLWLLCLIQKERNIDAGHREAIYGVFTSRENAVAARTLLMKQRRRTPGKFTISQNCIDEGGGVGGFYEYLPSVEFARLRQQS